MKWSPLRLRLITSFGHVEAGLKSNDLRMPEEQNRRIVDHISTVLYAPTDTSNKNLVFESVWGKIYVKGNMVIDAVVQYLRVCLKAAELYLRYESN